MSQVQLIGLSGVKIQVNEPRVEALLKAGYRKPVTETEEVPDLTPRPRRRKAAPKTEDGD